MRIVVGPKPRRQELHDDTDGGTEVRATVRGEASGATPSTIPGVPPTIPGVPPTEPGLPSTEPAEPPMIPRVPSPFLFWPTAVNASGTEAMSIDSEGERLSDAHHDWEERDGASDVGVEHTEEEIPELESLAIPPHSQQCSRNDEFRCSGHQNSF